MLKYTLIMIFGVTSNTKRARSSSFFSHGSVRAAMMQTFGRPDSGKSMTCF